MGLWTPARLAKVGFVIFAPVEIARLVWGETFLGAWAIGIVWLGEALIFAAAIWAALTWQSARLARALLGLLFLMIPVWPWYTLYMWDAGGMSTAGLLHGVDPAPIVAHARGEMVQVEYLRLIDSAKVTFPSSLTGCVAPRARGGPMAIVSLVNPDLHQPIRAAMASGVAISVVGVAVAAWHLWRLARTITDRAWVIAAILAAVIIGGLLLSQAAVAYTECVAPAPERSTYRLYLWLGVTLHPFGPLLLAVTGLLAWYWPRRIRQGVHARAQSRTLFRQQTP